MVMNEDSMENIIVIRTIRCFAIEVISSVVLSQITFFLFQLEFEFDRLLGTEYKPTGIKMKYNACEFYRKNIFGIKERFNKFGNIDLCNFVKVSNFLTI